MKNFLRILSLLLVLTMMLGCLLACTEDDEIDEDIEEFDNSITLDTEDSESEEGDDSQNDESESSTKKKPTTQNQSRIFTKDISKYKFVISANASDELKAEAKRACELAATTWSSDSVLKTDDYASGTKEKYEILIGETNRTESTKYKNSLKDGEGGYAINGTKITILGYTEIETLSALKIFLLEYIVPKIDNSIFFNEADNFEADLSQYVFVMSFNVYIGIENDAEKKANAMSLIRAYSPDVFGVQEASKNWQTTLKNEFSKDYHIVGVGRDANGAGEAMLIFARKSKFNVKSSGTKWLSNTPDKVSKVELSACNRIVTYAVLERISDGKIFNYANTHIDHVGGQEEQIRYLAQIIDNNMQKGAPTFVTGDFNITPDQSAFSVMTGLGYTPSFSLVTKNHSNGVGTLGNSAIIDYLFVRNGTNIEAYLYRVCNEKDYGENSDHYPVFNILKF